MTQLELLAAELGTSQRTLRRWAAGGLIETSRPSPRKLVLSPPEEVYLRRSWRLLAELKLALRTEPNVRLAVLFGSCARGTGGEASDVDVLVSLSSTDFAHVADLASRLSEAVDRRVQIVRLDDARSAPTLLAAALEEGRVLVDRDGHWQRLKRSEHDIRDAADRHAAELDRRAWETLEGVGVGASSAAAP